MNVNCPTNVRMILKNLPQTKDAWHNNIDKDTFTIKELLKECTKYPSMNRGEEAMNDAIILGFLKQEGNNLTINKNYMPMKKTIELTIEIANTYTEVLTFPDTAKGHKESINILTKKQKEAAEKNLSISVKIQTI